jgi:hypothetical protein
MFIHTHNNNNNNNNTKPQKIKLIEIGARPGVLDPALALILLEFMEFFFVTLATPFYSKVARVENDDGEDRVQHLLHSGFGGNPNNFSGEYVCVRVCVCVCVCVRTTMRLLFLQCSLLVLHRPPLCFLSLLHSKQVCS